MTVGSISVIYSNEDCVFYLNPQITFFKSIYRKYTNFVLNEHVVNHSDTDTISFPAKAFGDLLLNISLLYEETTTSAITARVQTDHPLTTMESLDFKIQEKQIESLNTDFLKIYFRLQYLNKHNIFYNTSGTSPSLQCDNGNLFQKMSLCGGCFAKDGISASKIIATIPLPFSFTKDIGKAIPLFLTDNKNSQDISITINYKKQGNDIKNFKTKLLLKLAYIGPEEKNRFRTTDNEYLLEKVFPHEITKLNFLYNLSESLPNRSIKEIFIENTDTKNYLNYSYNLFIGGISILDLATDTKEGNHNYFSKIKIYESFEGFNASFNGSQTEIHNNIAYIPFCLHNKSSAPSGTINTSSNKINFTVFPNLDELSSDDLAVKLYITYYSIMKITDGVVSLLYDYT